LREDEGCHAVFVTGTLGFSPELFSRVNGEVYICGLNTATIPLPLVATDAQVQPAAIEQLKEAAASMLGIPGSSDDLEIIRESLVGAHVYLVRRELIPYSVSAL
jgi:hypothetical protein